MAAMRTFLTEGIQSGVIWVICTHLNWKAPRFSRYYTVSEHVGRLRKDLCCRGNKDRVYICLKASTSRIFSPSHTLCEHVTMFCMWRKMFLFYTFNNLFSLCSIGHLTTGLQAITLRINNSHVWMINRQYVQDIWHLFVCKECRPNWM